MSPKSARSSPGPSKHKFINEGLSPWACVSCATRKVKCDRKSTCSNCAKAGISCEYRAPAPPQRKKRKAERDALNAMVDRLKQYEGYMKSIGVPFEPFDVSALPNQEDRRGSESFNEEEPSQGGEFVEEGGSSQRYFEHGLFASLSREFRDDLQLNDPAGQTADVLGDRSRSKFVASILLGAPSSPTSNWTGPLPISSLWQTFCNNIHPLTHVIHLPTMQEEILEYSAGQSTPDSSSEALIASICACALLSVSDTESYNLLGSPRNVALAMLQSAAKNALIESGFLTSPNVKSLQAFALFVTTLQSGQHPHTTSLLSKVGIHSARSLGLHRDGSRHGLPPFETEVRRRTWWYLLSLNARASELEGLPGPPIPPQSDALLPLNVDDQDLQPDMQELPVSQPGATEMIFCFMRYVMMKMSHQQQQSLQDRQREADQMPEQSISSDLERISQFEAHIEERFLGLCDPIIPLHAISAATARASICKMRLQALSVSFKSMAKTGTASEDMSANRTFFSHSLRLIGYDNLLQSSKSLKGFSWYIQHHFPWGALINLLRSLMSEDPTAICGGPDQVLKSWQQMDQLHRYNPEFLQAPLPAVRTIQTHVSDMTLQAWDNCYILLPPKAAAEPPDFVQALQARKQAGMSGSSTPHSTSRTPTLTEPAGFLRPPSSTQASQFNRGLFSPVTPSIAVQQQFPFAVQTPHPAGGPGDPAMFDMSSAAMTTPPEWAAVQWVDTQFPGFTGMDTESGQGWS